MPFVPDNSVAPLSPQERKATKAAVKAGGFFQRLSESMAKRASNVQSNVQQLSKGQISRPEYTLRGFGEAAGAVGDVAGEAISGAAKFAFKNFLTPETQGTLKTAGTKVLQSKPGQTAIKGLQQGVAGVEKFARENPRLATNLGAAVNIASVIPIGKGAQVIGKEALAIPSDTVGVLKRLNTPDVNKAIEAGISKGIKPSVVGKGSLAQMNTYKERAKEAVLNIVKNKDKLSYVDDFGETISGRTPQTLKEMTEAVDQTKKKIFSEYSALATKAGGQGVSVDLNQVTGELQKIINDKVVQTLSPETAKYAQGLTERFAQQGTFTPEQAQQAIANLNESLQSFYKNPTYGSFQKAQIDALIANNLREALDTTITGAVGEGYSALKKAYGALKAIEKDVIKRAVVEGRKAEKGLIDFTDVFSAGDVVMGLSTGNVAQIAKGGIQKAVASYIKRINSPDNSIKNMFESVEKAIKNKSEKFVPKSKTFKLLNKAKGKSGMSIQDISRSGLDVTEKEWDKLNVSAFMEALKDYGRKVEKDLNKAKNSPKINLDRISKLEDAMEDVKAAQKSKGGLSPEAAKLWSEKFKKLGIDFDEYYSLPQAIKMKEKVR